MKNGRGACRRTASDLLPAAAECVVKLNERQGLLLLRRLECELRAIEIGVGGEHFQVAGVPAVIAQARKPHSVRGCGRLLLLLLPVFAGFVIRNECVGDVAQGTGDGLLIGVEQLFVIGLGKVIVVANLTGVEDGL